MPREIEIRFGNSWKQEEEPAAGGRQAARRLDLTHVVDAVDILVEGANVSAKAPPDSIFLVLRDLVSRVEELLARRSGRANVSFYESPWELVLVLEGGSVLLSFYRAGARPRVELKDRVVGLRGLVEAVLLGGDALVQDLLGQRAEMVADPFVSELMGGLERIRATDLERRPADAIPVHASIPHAFAGKERAGCPLGLAYEMTATTRDLLSPVAQNRADLYCLMARGSLGILLEGKEVMRAGGYVYFYIEKLLEVSRALLGAAEEFKDLDLTIEVEEAELAVAYGPHEGQVTFSARPRARREPPVIFRRIGVFAFVDEALQLARDFRKKVNELNHAQRGNLKLELMSDEIDALQAWRKDLETQTVKKQAATPLRYEVPLGGAAAGEEAGRTVIARTRKLMYVQLWEAQVERIRLDATYLAGDRVILTGPQESYAVARDTGEVIWRRPLEEPDAVSIMTGESGILRFDPSGVLRLVKVEDGSTVWNTRITPPFGLPAGIVAGGGRRPRVAVLSSGEATLVGVDLYTGEAKWKHKTRRGSAYRFGKMGKLLFVTCASNSIHCLDVDSGELLWRYCGRHRFVDPPASGGGTTCAWGREWGGRGGSLYAFDSLTGNELWRAAGEGQVAAAGPVFAGGHVLGALFVEGELVVRAWRADGGDPSWERNLGRTASFFSWMAVDERVIINAAGGSVTCLDGRGGATVWTRNTGGETSEDVPISLDPVLRGGGLFVPADTTYVFSPADGTLLHRLDEQSPVPDFLRVDERYAIYVGEVSGYFSAYGVSGRLGVIEQ